MALDYWVLQGGLWTIGGQLTTKTFGPLKHLVFLLAHGRLRLVIKNRRAKPAQ